MKQLLVIINSTFIHFKAFAALSRFHISRLLKKLTEQEFVYFTNRDDISILNKVMMYLEKNEITKKLKIVTVLKDTGDVSQSFMDDLEVLDRAYPDIKIDYVQVHNATFGPKTIKRLSEEWNIQINFMFISSPSNKFSHRVSDLGGVRLIT